MPETPPPALIDVPTRVIVIVDAQVTPAWQTLVSQWLVRAGCLYMLAWGTDCSSWDNSVDWANIARFGGKAIPDDGFVVTTWHLDKPLEEVFWYAKNLAVHPAVRLERTILLEISAHSRRDELLQAYAST
ncbi:hypothetical protein G4G28_04485 [Massilia sp. Dwa41.01b]|uniref:DUF7684 family protein n=1 Tax=unclassified Massilia TaxID=2609279 RepID=UPI00160084D9|nr:MULTISPECIES: hypothetical protein [unclassified Massilia]QNA87908.1 hypothetical protein G4G28_04485 [Massilia sp. Dwa41.01b]QNA98811.1 hypothetical protein G4G31_08205 [Massilia sp. Se16.2.3]